MYKKVKHFFAYLKNNLHFIFLGRKDHFASDIIQQNRQKPERDQTEPIRMPLHEKRVVRFRPFSKRTDRFGKVNRSDRQDNSGEGAARDVTRREQNTRTLSVSAMISSSVRFLARKFAAQIKINRPTDDAANKDRRGSRDRKI